MPGLGVLYGVKAKRANRVDAKLVEVCLFGGVLFRGRVGCAHGFNLLVLKVGTSLHAWFDYEVNRQKSLTAIYATTGVVL